MNTNLDMMQMMQQIQQMTPEQMQLMMATMANIMGQAGQMQEAEQLTAAEPEPEKEMEKKNSGEYYRDFSKEKIDCVTSADDFTDGELYRAMFYLITKEVLQNKIQFMLEERAKNIGGTMLCNLFKKNCTAEKKRYKKMREQEAKKKEKEEAEKQKLEELAKLAAGHKTEFENLPEWVDGNRYIGAEWIANNENGIYKLDEVGNTTKIIEACGRPVLINKMLNPIDGGDGIERFQLAFEGERGWRQIVVERGELVNQAEAIKLANFGVDINSDRARAFTNCMSSMLRESSKRHAIPSIMSSRKITFLEKGEIKIPFNEDEFVFETENKFPGLLKALKPNKADKDYDEEKYMDAYKAIRAKKFPGFDLMTAAALASPIVALTKANSFLFNLHGITGCGKSFLECIVVTLFGDYHHDKRQGYVQTPLTTINAFEILDDALYCYPLMIDDYNVLTEKRDKDTFNKKIMMLSNGIGKGRATKDLGIQTQGDWANTTIISAEESIRELAKQGGVSNRLYEVSLDPICPFTKPEADAMIEPFNKTHGFAGIRFIEILNGMGVEEIRKIIKKYTEKITARMQELRLDKTNKQIDIAALLLTADEIAAEKLFCDKLQISVDEVIRWMADRDEVQQESRVYRTVIDKIYASSSRIEGLAVTEDDNGNVINDMRNGIIGVYNREIKGTEDVIVLDGREYKAGDIITTMAFIPSELKKILAAEGASYGSFKDYLKRNNLLIKYEGSRDDTVKVPSIVLNKRVGMLKFIIPDDEIPDEKPKDDKPKDDKPNSKPVNVSDEDIPFD